MNNKNCTLIKYVQISCLYISRILCYIIKNNMYIWLVKCTKSNFNLVLFLYDGYNKIKLITIKLLLNNRLMFVLCLCLIFAIK